MVCRRQRDRVVRDARSMNTGAMTQKGSAPRLVERREGRDAIPEGLPDHVGVLGEAGCGVATRPASGVLKCLRQVPVIERDQGRDRLVEQAVDQPGVEVETGLIHRARTGGHDSRPRDREPVCRQTEFGHDCDVFCCSVVVVGCDITGVTVVDTARRVAEGVPDRRAAPVGLRGSLDLVGRSRRAPHEAGREPQRLLLAGLWPRTTGGGRVHAGSLMRAFPSASGRMSH